jgi:dienelactone hydrolase
MTAGTVRKIMQTLGGLSTASLLASHGYPTLAVAYFHAAGLPDSLKKIPLEYSATAARLLAKQPGVDPEDLIALGASRGTEATLLLAQNFPKLVHGAVLHAPGAKVNDSPLCRVRRPGPFEGSRWSQDR